MLARRVNIGLIFAVRMDLKVVVEMVTSVAVSPPARDPAAGQEKQIGRTQGDRSRPLFGVERATEV